MTLLTEEEAKAKVCHVSMGVSVAPAGFEQGNRRCIASQCMAWREKWQFKDAPVGMKPDGDGWVEDGPARGAGGAVTHRQPWKRKGGFCGLAGKVEL